MAEGEGSQALPPPYFSNLYFLNQETRRKPPTREESQSMQRSDYEGQRYVVPEHVLNIQDPRIYFEQLQDKFDNMTEKDIRWFRKHSIDTTGSDYDYRFWLQYEVEKMAAGERSIKILNDLDNEYETAMRAMDILIQKFAVALEVACSKLAEKKTLEALGRFWHKNKELVESKSVCAKFLKQRFSSELKRNDNQYREKLEEYPLFFYFGRIILQRVFKLVRRVEFLPKKKKAELIDLLNELDIKTSAEQTVKELKSILYEQLSLEKHKDFKKELYTVGFTCAFHVLIDRLVDDFEKELVRIDKWMKSASSEHILSDQAWDELLFRVEDLDITKSGFRNDSIKLSTLCIKLLKDCEIAYSSVAAIHELGALYEKEFEKQGNNFPGVLRLTEILVEELGNGNHPIFRHFQQDVKRNMYCLPRRHVHGEFSHKNRAGGFLYNGRQTVSEHNTLRMYNLRGNIDGYRFQPSADTISALNTLQDTQWSINIDFLHFIAELTKDTDPLSTPVNDLRHAAWTVSDDMRLRTTFADLIDLDKDDDDTISIFSSISSTLKQARKNLLNAGNVFWHAWFCDWRGRFNTRIDQLGPQGDDLSKALLLFTEWKPLGERGRYWMYVRGYDLFQSILDGGSPKIHDFDAKAAWTQQKVAELKEMAGMLRLNTPQSELERVLSDLGFKPHNNKSERFQRVSYLLEFKRIHEISEENGGDWDSVFSGFPIHHDASCNGFQHIAALMRSEHLAESVNILPREDNSRGDLYQEVAEFAQNLYQEVAELAQNLNKHKNKKANDFYKGLAKFCDKDDNIMTALANGIFTREICKPLVMLAGYGAKDYSSPLFNKEGKNSKNAFGLYLRDDKLKKTLHMKSPLYEVICRVGDENRDWFAGVELQLDHDSNSDKLYRNIDAAEKLISFGKKVRDYLSMCVAKKTEGTFDELHEKLVEIYDEVDTENTMNTVRFRWQILDGGSQVRNIKWVRNKGKDFASLPRKLSEKGWSREEVVSFARANSNRPKDIERMQSLIEELESSFPHRLFDMEAKDKHRFNSNEIFITLKYHLEEMIRVIAKDHKTQEIREKARKIGNHFYDAQSKFRIRFYPHEPTNFKNLEPHNLRSIRGKIKQGLVPNFIHSFDACHMQMVILQLKSRGIHDIWAVHDSFGTHPCHVDELRSIVNSTFFELHNQPLIHHLNRIVKLNNDILKSDDLKFSDLEVKDGFSDWINRVLDAKYLVS